MLLSIHRRVVPIYQHFIAWRRFRYLRADSLSFSGVTKPTHSYGPPGVDLGSAAASTASLCARLKRNSSDQEHCSFYLKTGSFRYGSSWGYKHPKRNVINPLGSAIAPVLSNCSCYTFQHSCCSSCISPVNF